MIATGLDRLLADPAPVAGRRFGLLSHQAAVSRELRPAHLALLAAGQPPARLFAPEHGFYGVEQDMVPALERTDPLSDLPVVSLYGDDEASLRPRAEAFDALELLVVDLQDVGSRYYTYAATAVWAVEVALERGLEVLVLDRPNPLGGEVVEGNLPAAGLESFVSAFSVPQRHGLTLGELVLLEARRRGWDDTALRVLALRGWRRDVLWRELGRAWVAPSPNMPTAATAILYPGLCLLEATGISEGRGTTRPFHLVGAPGLDARALAQAVESFGFDAVRAVPTLFRPQFQKHAGDLCAGVELVLTGDDLAATAFGVRLLAALHRIAGGDFAWRHEPYEFVADRPAIDLLAGSVELRRRLERGEPVEPWIAAWSADEAAFREERAAILLYPEEPA